jgi:phosphotriesterase-related protein
MTAMVATVAGEVPAEALGRVLPHEHVLCDLTPMGLRDPFVAETEITLANAFEVAYRPNAHKGNHLLTRRDVAADELRRFAAAGGTTICDLTTEGIAPDPEGLRSLSLETGVAIVMGAGFYTAEFVPAEVRGWEVARLAAAMERQLAEGVGGTGVRAGLIGEVGCSWPLDDFERRSLRAAAEVSRRTGAAVSVHPGRHPEAPHEIMDVLERAGADPSRVAIGHVERTLPDFDAIVRLAARGCWIEMDFFGIETSRYWFGAADLPTDWMRIRWIRQAGEEGFGDRLLLSHDICTRSRLAAFGGHGYGHLFTNVAGLMRERGFDDAAFDRLTIANPRRFLSGEA